MHLHKQTLSQTFISYVCCPSKTFVFPEKNLLLFLIGVFPPLFFPPTKLGIEATNSNYPFELLMTVCTLLLLTCLQSLIHRPPENEPKRAEVKFLLPDTLFTCIWTLYSPHVYVFLSPYDFTLLSQFSASLR